MFLMNMNDRKGKAYKFKGMNNSHSGRIVKMCLDNNGNLWTIQENGEVIIWDKDKLFLSLAQGENYQEEIMIQNSFKLRGY